MSFSEQLFMRPGAHPVTHEKLALPSSAIIGVGVGLGFDSDCDPDSDSDPDGWWM